MPGPYAAFPIVFAEAAPAANSTGNPLTFYLLLLYAPLLFYFFFIRPNRQQEKRRQELLNALKKNDKVLTVAGIYGTVIAVDPDADKVVLRVDDDKGVRMTVTKASVAKVLEATAEKD